MVARCSEAVKREVFTEHHHATLWFEPNGRSCYISFGTYSIHTKHPLKHPPQHPPSALADWKQGSCRQWVQGGGGGGGRQAGLLAMRMCMEMQMWMWQQQEAMVVVGRAGEGWWWWGCQCGRAGWLMLERVGGACYVTLCWHWMSSWGFR